MQDEYSPEDQGAVQCPKCGRLEPDVHGPSRAVELSWDRITCPGCGATWTETRDGRDRLRYWAVCG